MAVSLAFSPELSADLLSRYPEAADSIETHGTWEGEAQKWYFDFADGSYRWEIRLNTAGEKLYVHFAGPEPPQIDNAGILRLTGVRIGDEVAATSASVLSLSTTGTSASDVTSTSTIAQPLSTTGGAATRAVVQPMSSTATAASGAACGSTTGLQNTAVLLVNFPGQTIPSYLTAQTVYDSYFGTTGRSLNGYWQEASYGATSTAGAVFGWYQLSQTYACSNFDALFSEAINLATSAGVNLPSYTHIVLVNPDFGCGWAGAAGAACASPTGTFTATTAYVNGTLWGAGNDSAVATVAHEAGHNLGLNHSNTRGFGTEALGPLGTQGTETEYGDGFTAMSNGGLGHYDAPHKVELLNWIGPSNYQVVQSSGTWTIQPIESAPTGLQALKIQRGTGNNAWLWVEYRQPIGNYDNSYANGNVWSNQVFSGAVIHYEDSLTPTQHTDLLDFTPTSPYLFYDPALAAGQTWTDPYSNLSLTIQSATATGLTVTASYGTTSTCTHSNPTVTLSPANPSIAAGSSVNYTLSVTNNDASGCPAGSFSIASAQPAGWAGTLSSATLTANPGQTATATLTEAAPATAAPGTYALSASAANGTYTNSASANCTVTTGSASPTLTDTVSAGSPTYTARQTASVTSIVLSGGSAASGASVTFTLTKPNGSNATGKATANSTGTAVWSYKFGPKDPSGTYSVVSTATYQSQTATSNTATFTLR